MKLTNLHEEFMHKARNPVRFGALPVSPKAADVPVMPVNRWIEFDGMLQKSYQFMEKSHRNDFIRMLLEHEEKVKHNAEIMIFDDTITLRLQTKDVNRITELDKEYSKWVDALYKDLVYSHPRNG